MSWLLLYFPNKPNKKKLNKTIKKIKNKIDAYFGYDKIKTRNSDGTER